MEWIRAFVALNLPVAATNDLATAQRGLRNAAGRSGARVSWVPAPNMHVTLKFLGDIAGETMFLLRDRLARELAERPAFSVKLGGLGVFPDERRPRVLWAGVEDVEPEAPLARLAVDVEGWLDELGFEPEQRPFHGHVTLGRIKELGGSGPFWGHTAVAEQRCAPTEVVLYRSLPQRQDLPGRALPGWGAEYEALGRFPFGRTAASSEPPLGAELEPAGEPHDDDDASDAGEKENVQHGG